MTKQISIDKNNSFSELDWNPGELIALDNTDSEYPSPLILTIPKDIIRGHDSTKGIKILYHAYNGEREEWTLNYTGNLMQLWGPDRYTNKLKPNFKIAKENFPPKGIYFVEYAISGEEKIKEYLKGSKQGLDFYAKCIESGKLNIKRSALEKNIEKIGLKNILPPQLRFK